MLGVVAGLVLTKDAWQAQLHPRHMASTAAASQLSTVQRAHLHELAMESFCHELTDKPQSRQGAKRTGGGRLSGGASELDEAGADVLYFSYGYGALPSLKR